ncbi:MAG: hypothetical protein IT371_15635 [Deltaproteobacteria bacterium]|nr:hypothetical protein [Deltaproteobacteria bacterium]
MERWRDGTRRRTSWSKWAGFLLLVPLGPGCTGDAEPRILNRQAALSSESVTVLSPDEVAGRLRAAQARVQPTGPNKQQCGGARIDGPVTRQQEAYTPYTRLTAARKEP